MSETNGKLTQPDVLFGAPIKRRYRTVELPVSGHHLRIQSITEQEFSNYQDASMSKKGDRLIASKLRDANRRFMALCMVDTDGNRILSTKDSGKLADWDAGDSQYLYNECATHCKINSDDIEDAVKNSEGDLAES